MQNETTDQMIARHEGYREHIYRCSKGKLTIGYGYNLDSGMPEDEALILMGLRILKIISELKEKIPWFEDLNDARKMVLVDMAYQMGVSGLLGFKKMFTAMRVGNYERAYTEMLDSKWAKRDTPERAKELSVMMRTGSV